MKLLGNTENKITTEKTCRNVPHLEITEVILVHCNIVTMIIKFYIHLFQVKPLVVYQKFHQQMLSFLKTFKSKFQGITV